MTFVLSNDFSDMADEYFVCDFCIPYINNKRELLVKIADAN